MSFLLLSDNASHDPGSVDNNPWQLNPGPNPYTRKKKTISLNKYNTRKARTSGEEILTFRMFVSIISLLSQTDSVRNQNSRS